MRGGGRVETGRTLKAMAMSPVTCCSCHPSPLQSATPSRRRDCYSAAPPSLPLLGVSIETMRECQQNNSLADG